MSRRTWKRLGLKEPTVTKHDGYWTVVRPIVWRFDLPDQVDIHPYVITENVSDDGGDRVVSRRQIRSRLAQRIEWGIEWGE